MTVFGKPTLWTQILNPFFACRRKSHSCTIQRQQALETRWPGLLLQAAFFNADKPPGCISWPVWSLSGINKTAWGGKLILTADLAFPVSCASLGHLRTDGTALPFVLECLHKPTYTSPTTNPSLPPTPIDSRIGGNFWGMKFHEKLKNRIFVFICLRHLV